MAKGIVGHGMREDFVESIARRAARTARDHYEPIIEEMAEEIVELQRKLAEQEDGDD